jgi:peroxiredoxin
MIYRKCVFFIAVVLLASPLLRGQATEASINKQLQALSAGAGPGGPGGMPGAPGAPGPAHISEVDRPAAILQVAKDIGTLPAGLPKVRLANGLAIISTQGDVGMDALQAAADTLARAVEESPQPENKGLPAPPYVVLAKLARYGGITTSLKDPELTKAGEILAANDADVAKADFTLKDLNGKKVTLSSLRGKIVLINFWATECGTCHKEMQDLDLIYTHYQQQGLVVLSITDENPFKVNGYLSHMNYHPTVLFDDGDKAGKAFHIDGIPRTFVLDRDGKLAGESIDMCTQRQFFAMLGKAGLQPNK